MSVVSQEDDAQGTELLALCASGSLEPVRALLRQRPLLARFVDDRGRTPLLAAVQHEGVVRALLGAGADVAAVGRGGWTPLHAACERPRCEGVVQELLGAGASCLARNDDGNTPLHYLVRHAGAAEHVLAVVAGRSAVDAVNRAGETALFTAAWRDNATAVALLLRMGADVALANARGQTPLHAAALFGSERCCRALLAAGADVLCRDQAGLTPVDAATHAGCLAVLREAQTGAMRRARVVSWLTTIGVESRYHEAFVREEFDLSSLALVTEEVLVAMKLPAAVRLTVAHAARLLDAHPAPAVAAAAAAVGVFTPKRSGGSALYHRLVDSTTSDLEEDAASEEPPSAQKIRDVLLARNVPVLDSSELQLRHVIGSGFFSQVRLAEWNGVLVACKNISESPQRLKTQRELFLQEVTIMARLRHPNIVQFLGVTVEAGSADDEQLRGSGGPGSVGGAVPSGTPFGILTEYMPGGTLHAAIRAPRWLGEDHMRRFFRISTDVCKGMVYLHGSAGVIHRDLTPKNVLLDVDYNAKIADFGVSRIDNPDYLTLPVGALPYVAPEVYLHHRYSTHADVFSFAVILWEMLTGLDVCEGFKPKEMADSVAHKQYRPKLPVPAPDGWIEPGLLTLVENCWAQRPELRPSFLVVLHSLENMVNRVTDAGYVLERVEL